MSELGQARRILEDLRGSKGDAALYRVTPPLGGYSYVVVSAITALDHGGPETFIFGADSSGEILDWSELDGSQRGTLDHAQALTDAGYRITD